MGGTGFFGTSIIGLLRWRFFLRSLNLKLPFRNIFYSLFSSFFFNLFFPSFIAGDVFRSCSLYKYNLNKIIPSVFMDRFSGMIALGIIVCFASILGGELIKEKEIVVAILLFLGVIVGITLIAFSKKFLKLITKCVKNDNLKRKIVALHNELYFFREHPKILLKSLIYALSIQCLTCLSFFSIARGFYLNTNIIYFFTLIPIIMIVSALPVTIAGAGTREGATIYLFSKIGVDSSISLSMSLLYLMFQITLGLIGGILYVMVHCGWLEYNK